LLFAKGISQTFFNKELEFNRQWPGGVQNFGFLVLNSTEQVQVVNETAIGGQSILVNQ
jgi:hypothetical protein